MQRSQETGRTPPWESRRGRAAVALFAASCALFSLALSSGCNTLKPKTATAEGDPLQGPWRPKTFDAGPVPARPTTSKAGPLPSLPSATSANSNTAILTKDAQSEPDPLLGDRGGRELVIGGQGAWQGGEANGKAANTLVSAQGNGGLRPTLRGPEPVAEVSQAGTAGVPAPPPPPAPGVVATATWPAGSGAGPDYDQLQGQLKARGVTWQRQETFNDGFKFTCFVTNPFNPEFTRTYEATAHDYKSALQAVLEQIDRDRQKR